MTHIFDRIAFDEPTHTYTLNGQPLRSVSSVISKLRKPFDADYWAPRKAAERGITEEEIRAEWKANREAGQAKGERVHAHIEQVIRGTLDLADPFLALNELLPEEKAFNRFWGELSLGGSIELSKWEWIVGDPELSVAGRLDALVYSPATGKRHIWDWKTGTKFNTSSRYKFLHPWDEVDDCELTYYSAQASLYRLIVERGTGEELGDSYILYLGSDEVKVHKAIDYRERLLAWLTS
jgi:hypothetical protein